MPIFWIALFWIGAACALAALAYFAPRPPDDEEPFDTGSEGTW